MSVLVNADPNLLRQAIANLLSNAFRYTPARGSITLRLLTDDQQARIQVEDPGIGIPTEALRAGEQVSVTGEYDDEDFDAFSITRANGEVIQIREADGPPPWAGRRRSFNRR